MIVCGHQPVYMPWLGLLHKIASCDVFVSWDDVQMEDSGFENRQRCVSQPEWLTVPVRRARTAKIKDLEVCADQPWQRKHFRAIEQEYEHAPNWKEQEPFLRWLLVDQKWTYLAALNDAILSYLMIQFRVTAPRRVRLSDLKTTTKKNEQIIEACRALGATKYLFGEMGKGYCDRQLFLAAGIEPMVQEYNPVVYPQQSKPGKPAAAFRPRLWAFDLLLNVERGRAIEFMMAGGRVRRMPQ